MTQALNTFTKDSITPLDAIVQQMAGELALLHMTRLCRVTCPDQEEAESLAEDLREIIKIVDNGLAAIGAQASGHFGFIDKTLFQGQLDEAMEGNAIYDLLTSIQSRHEAEGRWWGGRAA